MKEDKNEKRRGSFNEPKEVLIFKPTGTYIGRVCSVRAIAELMVLAPQTISRVCKGERVIAREHYYRFMHPDIEVNSEDYNTLTVMEYDKMCKFNGVYLTAKERKTMRKAAAKRKQKGLKNDD